MRYFAVFLLLFAFGFTMPSCAQRTASQKGKTKKAATQTPPTSETRPVLTFERTPCFGTCPGYSMTVFADGRVQYEGRRAVPMMGQRELKLTPAAVTNMLQQAQEARFDQFQDKYVSGATDLPTTIIAIRQPNGELKTVVAESNAPDNVRNLFTALSNQFDTLAKIPVTSDK